MTQTDARIISSFRTKDLNQAAFIWCQPGAKLKKLVGSQGRGTTVHFIFEIPVTEEDLVTLIMNYANKDTKVEPQEFCSKQSNLRDLLHGSLRRKSTEEGLENDAEGITTN